MISLLNMDLKVMRKCLVQVKLGRDVVKRSALTPG